MTERFYSSSEDEELARVASVIEEIQKNRGDKTLRVPLEIPKDKRLVISYHGQDELAPLIRYWDDDSGLTPVTERERPVGVGEELPVLFMAYQPDASFIVGVDPNGGFISTKGLEDSLTLNLRPKTIIEIAKENIARLDPSEYQDQIMALRHLEAAVEEFRSKLLDLPRLELDSPYRYIAELVRGYELFLVRQGDELVRVEQTMDTEAGEDYVGRFAGNRFILGQDGPVLIDDESGIGVSSGYDKTSGKHYGVYHVEATEVFTEGQNYVNIYLQRKTRESELKQ